MTEAEALAWKAQREAEAAAHAKHRATPKHPAVIVFGRFNPPTTGHARLIEFLQQEASRRRATPIVFPSVGQSSDKDPLPFGDKVRILRQMFPNVVVSGNAKLRTPFHVMAALTEMGFDAVWFVVGSDRAASFEKMVDNYIKPKGLKNGRHYILKQFGVLTVPVLRDSHVAGIAGMSASKLRQAAVEGDWTTFRAGTPTKNDRFARTIYDKVRSQMGLTEMTQRKPAFLLYGTTARVAQALREGFEQTVKRAHPQVPYRDMSGSSAVDVRQCVTRLRAHGYEPTIYVWESAFPRTLSEAWVKTHATLGELRRWASPRVIVLGQHKLLEMVTHAETVLEASDKLRDMETPSVLGYELDRKSLTPKRSLVDLKRKGDYGADPVGDGTFRMVPSGDIVDYAERNRRLTQKEAEGQAPKPKEPTETDRLRTQQKQEDLLLKKRQSDQLLAAQQRDLSKKSREASQKINKPKTGAKG